MTSEQGNQGSAVEQIVVAATKRQKRATVISAIFFMITLAASGIWLYFSFNKVTELEQLSHKLNHDIEGLNVEKRHLEEETKRIRISLGPDSFNQEQIVSSVEGKRRQALETAFQLYIRKVPYKWGGKTPEEGFDTSGFITYLLKQVNARDNPGLTRSVELEKKYGMPNSQAPKVTPLADYVSQKLKPGDIIFYPHQLLMLYLGDDRCMGMLPTKGLVVTEIDFGFDIRSLWEVRY